MLLRMSLFIINRKVDEFKMSKVSITIAVIVIIGFNYVSVNILSIFYLNVVSNTLSISASSEISYIIITAFISFLKKFE